MRTAACGHGHYDAGHCGEPGCENDFRRCPICNPSAFPGKRPKRDHDEPRELSGDPRDWTIG